MPKGFKVKQVFQLAFVLAVVIWLGCSLGSEAMGLWSWSLEKTLWVKMEKKEKESDRLVKSGEVSCHSPSGRGDLIRIE